MRILHLGKYFPPYHGGIERFVDELSAAQQRAGHQVGIIVHSDSRQSETSTLKDGRLLWRVPTFGQLFFAPIAPDFHRWLSAVVDKFRPDVLHAHVPNTSAFLAQLFRPARSVPMVVHWHSDVLPDGGHRSLRLAYPLYRPMESALLRHAKQIVATSPPYAAASATLKGHASKIKTVPLGIDPETIASHRPPTATSPWPNGRLRLLFIGRDTHYKGLDLLLQAVQAINGVTLAVVGQAGQDSETVRYLGHVDDAQRNQWLAQCDAVCLPSRNRHEAFGVVLLEAAAAGKPVVAADIPGSGVGWVVAKLQNGVLFEPGDADSLVNRIEEFRSETFRQRLGQAGQDNLTRHFHIDTVRAQLDKIYSDVRVDPDGG